MALRGDYIRAKEPWTQGCKLLQEDESFVAAILREERIRYLRHGSGRKRIELQRAFRLRKTAS